MSDLTNAMTARSLRNIKTELEFLADAKHISVDQLEQILAILPTSTPSLLSLTSSTNNLSLATQNQSTNATTPAVNPTPTPGGFPLPLPKRNNNTAQQQQTTSSYNEKASAPVHIPQISPPAYTAPTLATVSAIYAYVATDAGDLALQPGDTINVTEYVNADWWRGVNTLTEATGIFPRSYVKEVPKQQDVKEGYGYGNVPLQVASQPVAGGGGGGQVESQVPSKTQEQGKKFGKKLGNAAIFGAGATIGSNIVNSIF